MENYCSRSRSCYFYWGRRHLVIYPSDRDELCFYHYLMCRVPLYPGLAMRSVFTRASPYSLLCQPHAHHKYYRHLGRHWDSYLDLYKCQHHHPDLTILYLLGYSDPLFLQLQAHHYWLYRLYRLQLANFDFKYFWIIGSKFYSFLLLSS